MQAIIAITNQKGGVGKTATTVNLSVGIGALGYRVLVVDTDPQGNSTQMLLHPENSFRYQDMEELICRKKEEPSADSYAMLDSYLKALRPEKSLFTVFHEPLKIQESIVETQYPNVSIIPSSIELVSIEDYLVVQREYRKEDILKLALRQVRNEYDVVLIDCPPNSDTLVTNALMASNYAFIPVKIGLEATEGFYKTVQAIDRLNNRFGADVEWKLILNMFNPNQKMDKKFREMIVTLLGDKVFQTTIRNQTAAASRSSFNRSIFINEPKLKVAEDYQNLIKEIL